MKQNAFAEKADVPPISYNQWERGAVYPPVPGAIKLCETYGLTLDWIYMGRMDCLPTHLSDAIRALSAAEAAQQPIMTVVQPQPRHRKKIA
jgi:DNA-binding XRE family transcriptional regulator